MKLPPSETLLIEGPVGPIEILVEVPENPCGIALIAHPHPLFGGTHTNKVVQTLARGLCELGFVALRPAFRGVGRSAGVHDQGKGETEDLLAVLTWAATRWPELADSAPVLAGFSFGAYVQTLVAKRLAEAGHPARRLILVAIATNFSVGTRLYVAEPVPADTLLIHGREDVTVPLENVRAWADPQGLHIVVIPGADHFFSRYLPDLREQVLQAFPRPQH